MTGVRFPIMWAGSASVVFMTLDGMESLLSHQYFRSENKTEMNSDVFTVILPSVNNTNLTEPVNFTIQHKKVPHPSIHPSIPLNLVFLFSPLNHLFTSPENTR